MGKTPRKRQYGSGSIVPPVRPGGTWAIRVRVGKKRHYQGGIPTRELATQALAKYQAEGAAEELGLPRAKASSSPIEDYAPAFLARRKLTHEAWKLDAQRWNRHVGPFFGRFDPTKVDAGLIRRFIEEKLTAKLSPSSIRTYIGLLSSLFEELVEDKICDKNPARGLPQRITRMLVPTYDPRTTPFVERLSDVRRIFALLEKPLNIAYAIGAFGGLRTSEVFGLRWRSVDLEARRIHVREQRGRKWDGSPKQLKDKDSRVVPILDALLPVLTRWKLETGGASDVTVIPALRSDGSWIGTNTPGPKLRAVLKELGLARPGLGWYEATRHTFASQWVMNGGTIEKLREILGHSTVAITERYAHLRVDLFSPADLERIPGDLVDTPAPLVPLVGTKVVR
ncbi:phage integrase family protein [Myxococcus stipitatus DSM 14675]|uniref:Phage integrase family protein n=1 Tax=Myxococcus stipitatus (strain DSM 14675 / JCM 12634 / Mx s8) TaxID=1278073 RepID=L7UA16_MYXSD|nr:site-specific integrase [Myxococcus stipitatus]AGC43304.1 phage integrase family protein [Myxococcus stipitatus DSM 14675]